MKQLIQNMRTGELLLINTATPRVLPGHLLIQTLRSLISSGTERSLVDFARGGYLRKAATKPDKVNQLLAKARTDGLVSTLESVFAKLDQPVPLGYCNVGRVLEIGEGVNGFKVGDRVASNGRHAELVVVPANLCAKVPYEVSNEQASFTVVGYIGLHGVRCLNPTLGESVAVFGLGLIGLLAAQILRAHGARVIGLDFNSTRVELARKWGIDAIDLSTGVHPVQAGVSFSGGHGIDGVLITAAAEGHELIHQAAQMSRKRGRLVLTGVTGLHLRREDFYEKELTFQVSCSYGPGRYDPFYEEQGHDYPLGYVRWTEQRNFEAVLELMRAGCLRTGELLSLRLPFLRAKEAYDGLADRKVIGALLEYEAASETMAPSHVPDRVVIHNIPRNPQARPVIGVIGSGSFAQLKLIPALRKTPARLKWTASVNGISGAVSATKYGFERSTTDYRQILEDPEVTGVIISTRHDSHAELTIAALQARKSVFVEKPLCLSSEELDRVVRAYQGTLSHSSQSPILMVGYNRRFSALVCLIKSRLKGRLNPLAMHLLCNAGVIPPSHWVHNPTAGGGRITGEACHFIDLLHFIAEAPIRKVSAFKQVVKNGKDLEDNVSINLSLADGSIGTVHYFACGTKSFPKEHLHVFSEGRILVLNNFKRLDAYGFAPFKGKRLWWQDKGHMRGMQAFIGALVEGKRSPIPFDSIVHTTQATLAAVKSFREEGTIELEAPPLCE